MKMTFRWFGEKDDSVTLNQIKQIPGVSGVVGALFDIPVGEVWPEDKIHALKKSVEESELSLEVIESVNIHEDIKLGVPTRDYYIDNYKQTIRHLARAGVKVICYNFMPVFDWLRTDLAHKLDDHSETMAYDHSVVNNIDPGEMVKKFGTKSRDFKLPGWEPDRLAELQLLLDRYREMDEEKLFSNLKYFLEQIIPVCEEENIKLAIHPDDPPWPIFGLPRIVTSYGNLDRIISLVDSECNGLTLCSGSLGADTNNNIPQMIRDFGRMGRIHFGHVRNLKYDGYHSFHETSHLSADGSLDMYEMMKAYADIGFTGYIRPDHGRLIWGEKARPGYGLYDRALGVTYLNGLWEAIQKSRKRSTN